MTTIRRKNMDTKEGIDALFLYATEGILVADEKGHIVRINPSAEKLFGYEKNELLGKSIEVLVPQRFNHRHQQDRENYNHNPHARSMGAGRNLSGLRKSGTEFPVEISLSPYVNTEGKFVIAFIVDITVRQQAEERLRSYSTDLEKQVRERTLILEEAIGQLEETKKDLYLSLAKEKELNELKSRFVSMASHEFRTPLTTMLSSLSLISRYGEMNDLPNQAKHVSKIKESINNLTDILNDFLSLGKLEEGRIENAPETFNLRIFIDEILTEIKPLSKSALQFISEYEGQEMVCIDRKLLKNVLFNLLSNAIKFSSDGKDVRIAAIAAPPRVSIAISDQGIGIPLQDQKHLFDRFFRGHNATHIQGTGLGLSIVSRYLELMKGSIDFKSIENEGTTFTITIPQ